MRKFALRSLAYIGVTCRDISVKALPVCLLSLGPFETYTAVKCQINESGRGVLTDASPVNVVVLLCVLPASHSTCLSTFFEKEPDPTTTSVITRADDQVKRRKGGGTGWARKS